jgi:hypothetical protein
LANTEHPETIVTSKKMNKAIFFIESSCPSTMPIADLPFSFDDLAWLAPNHGESRSTCKQRESRDLQIARL